MRTAEELHRRGVTAINAGRIAVARAALLRALDRAEDDELRARVESSLAYCSAQTGETAEGLALCDRALSRSGLSAATRGSIHGQRGLLLMLAGETGPALTELDAAISGLDEAPDYLGRALLNRGGVYLQQEQPGLAEDDFRQAAAELARAGLPVEEAMARHNLGYCRLLRGDLVRALRDMDAARPVLAPLSKVSEATCEQDRAEVLMAAGLATRGRQALGQAARIYGSRRLHQRRGEAELTLARSLLLSDAAAALQAARAARARFARSHNDAWRVRAEGVALTAEVELGRRGPSLVTRADAIAAQLAAQGLGSPADLVRLHAARVLVRRSRLTEASARLAEVTLDEDTSLTVALVARTAGVELETAAGRPERALAEAARGLEELHAWQSTFGSLDLQTSVVGRGQVLAQHGLELAVASGRPALLLEWSERARMLTSRVRPVRPPTDPVLADVLAELRQLHAAEEAGGPADRVRAEQLRRLVRERALQTVGSGEVADPVSLEELCGRVGPDDALAAYVATAERLVGLLVTDAGATWCDLGARDQLDQLLSGLRADLDVAGSDLPPTFAGPVRRELTHRLGRLSSLLVAPLLPAIGDRRLVVTPSGVLAGVPWGLLTGLQGRPVTVARSATSWLGRATVPLRADSAGFVAGPRVPRAVAEVEAASSVWRGSAVLAGADATSAAVSSLASRVDVLHVSAHGRHSAENPLFSGVELVDGPWFGYDIDQLGRVPEVVLLSACELGRSQVRYGEELIGMTTAWLHAGTRFVIASAAAVNDAVAHDVLVGVHRGLAAGLGPPAALADALSASPSPLLSATPASPAASAPSPFVCFT